MAEDRTDPGSGAPAPSPAERPTTYNKRAQIVAVALVVIVLVGLIAQTVINMRARSDRQVKADAAQQQPIVTGARQSSIDDFKTAQDQAARELAATNAAQDEKTKRDRMMESIASRTTNPDGTGTMGIGNEGAVPRITVGQVQAEFLAEETKRVLLAGREGFGRARPDRPGVATTSVSTTGTRTPSTGSQAGAAPANGGGAGNSEELSQLQQQIGDAQSAASRIRADGARLLEVAQQMDPSLANQLRASAAPAAAATPGPASLANAMPTGIGGSGAQLFAQTAAQLRPVAATIGNSTTFGESAQNRAYRDPDNAGPRPGEMLMSTGAIASAVLQNDVISDYDGNWIAVLQRPVYDPAQEWVLLPTGTKVVGKTVRVSRVNEVIQNRMGFTVLWAIRPDGKRIDLRRTAGLDSAGVAALRDQVDYHVAAQFLGVLAYAVVGLGPSMNSFGTEANTAPDSAVREATGQARDVGRNFASKYLQIVPTVTIRSGTPIKIFFEDDIYVTAWASVDARFFSSRE